MRFHWVAGIFSFSIALCFSAHSAEVCTEAELRSALAAGGTVTFGCDQVIVLSTPLQINTNVELDGNGRNVTLSGGRTTRIFEVAPGVTFFLKNLRVVDGYHKGANAIYIPPSTMVNGQAGLGGALAATNATIRLWSCIFSNNVAQGGDLWEGGPGFPFVPGGASSGGAIYLHGGEFTSTNSFFVTNRARASEYLPSLFFPEEKLEWTDSNGGALSMISNVVTISGCNFDRNRSVSGGGGIHVHSSELAIEHCTFNSNIVVARTLDRFERNPEGSGRGGALEVTGQGSTSIRNSSFRGNQLTRGGRTIPGASSTMAGGAIFLEHDIEILGSEFVGNSIRGTGYSPPIISRGGAVCIEGAATIRGSRFADNSIVGGNGAPDLDQSASVAGSAYGGALYVVGAFRIIDSSCVSNSAIAGGASFGPFPPSYFGRAEGSAIFASNSVYATNVTIALNIARDSATGGLGGALHFTGGGTEILTNQLIFCTVATNSFGALGRGSPLRIVHSVITTNVVATLRGTILSGGSTNTVFGQIADAGFNLSTDSLFSDATSKNSIDAKLGRVGIWGGGTETIPLLSGSPAINTVTSGVIQTDQRGRARPAGAGDIGAYELSAPFVVSGRIKSGSDLTQVSLTTSGEAAEVDSVTGEFIGFFPEAGVLKPTAPGFVFDPEEIPLESGIEIFDATFAAYKLNEVAVEAGPDSILTLSFAAESAGSYKLQYSRDLNDWSDGETRTIAANSLFRTEIPAELAQRFFRFSKQ